MDTISSDSSTHSSDVAVIGGGPAGTTVATCLARQGRRVALIEKEQHPRFHIGESLLPMNLPILERLGVLDKIRAVGVPKLGADFTIGNSGAGQRTFYFGSALGASPDHAFEVRRSEFDRILFEHCANTGVHTLEGMKVCHVEAMKDGMRQITATDADGESHPGT